MHCQTSTVAPGSGVPPGSRTRPVTTQGRGLAIRSIESPFARTGDAVMWNGPSTVLSVPSVCPLIVSTSIETPSTSDSSTYSCRVSSHFWPVSVRNRIARSHSATVGRTSRT